MGGQAGGVEGGEMLAKERGDKSRQHVARAAGRHAGIAGGVQGPPPTVGDERTVPFQQYHRARLGGQGNRGGS